MRILLGLVLCGLAALASAQPVGESLEQDREMLRKLLAERVADTAPPEEWRSLFDRQVRAAQRAGDPAQVEALLRRALQRLPRDSRWPNDLAWVLADRGRYAESRELFEAAMALAATESDRQFYAANRLHALVSLHAPDVVQRIEEVKSRALALQSREDLPPYERIVAQRALGKACSAESRAVELQGRLGPALAARAEAERWERKAFDSVQQWVGSSANLRFVVATALAVTQRDRAYLLMRLGRLGEAATLVDEHLRFAREHALSAALSGHALRALAMLHARQGQWTQAEAVLRRNIEFFDAAKIARTHPFQLGRQADLIGVLWAAGRVDGAQRVLDELDTLRSRSKLAASAVRFSFERGLVELAAGRPAHAVPLFSELAEGNQRRYGPGAFYTAQARALHGVALWATQDAAQREPASELLKEALLDMLAPRNADLFDDAPIRKPVRELVFRTYLEAAAWRGGLQALVAMGVADRLAGGGAARAVADAAVRAAASDAALSELVRREQDLRQQIEAARGEGSGVPDDAGRRRLADLELQRQQAQESIRSRFPEYDRLLHPPLVNPTEVAQRLRRNEVLLLAVPTAQALYLWALNADELPVFARVEVTAARLAQLVDRVRAGVDFDLNGGRTGRFDQAAAQELSHLVLAPVAARLQGRQHLIVSSSGALARLPFALLPDAGAGDADWLVRRMAVSHVPSVASWLALRQGQVARSTTQPLLAWADPRFAGAARKGPQAQRGERQYAALPPLPESREEALTLARALKANPERDVIAGEKATRDSVLEANRSGRLAQTRVLLFATHGLTPGDLPGVVQPGLAMSAVAGENDVERFLVGLDDVLAFRLNAEWVVLSACNTAGGDGRAEEALSGLARGFLYAGARTLMVSHWAVETESARWLTTRTFAHQVANLQASKAESLRQAMLELMAQPKYAHPAYWAPFALVGEGGR